MNRLLATLQKDLLLLRRDRPALVLLFLMPLALVIVISLVQDSTLRLMEGSATEILLVNRDHAELGRIMNYALTSSGMFRVSEPPKDPPLSDEEIRAQIAKGQPKVCLFLPAGASKALVQRALKRYLTQQNIRNLLTSPSQNPDSSGPVLQPLDNECLPELCFYSKMLAPSRQSIQGGLSQIFNEMEIQIILNVLTNTGGFRKSEQETAQSVTRLLNSREITTALTLSLMQNHNFPPKAPTHSFRVRYTPGNGPTQHPNASQQNIPAWSVFAMFFIVVPLSAGFIRERQSGTFNRLRTLPGSFLPILLGKLLAYLGVCLLQFGLILVAGIYLLPALGIEPAHFVLRPFPLLTAALSVALAATSLGLLIGSAASTHEQASVFGAVSVIIASAIGGIMVPVFAMPQTLARLSVVSPLNWGLEALLRALTPDSGATAPLLIPVGALILFSLVCIVSAWILRSRLRP